MNVPEAVDIVCQALITDEGYRRSWQANIAMAFQDEFHKSYMDSYDLHRVANTAATNFLSRLCETPLKDLYAEVPTRLQGEKK